MYKGIKIFYKLLLITFLLFITVPVVAQYVPGDHTYDGAWNGAWSYFGSTNIPYSADTTYNNAYNAARSHVNDSTPGYSDANAGKAFNPQPPYSDYASQAGYITSYANVYWQSTNSYLFYAPDDAKKDALADWQKTAGATNIKLNKKVTVSQFSTIFANKLGMQYSTSAWTYLGQSYAANTYQPKLLDRYTTGIMGNIATNYSNLYDATYPTCVNAAKDANSDAQAQLALTSPAWTANYRSSDTNYKAVYDQIFNANKDGYTAGTTAANANGSYNDSNSSTYAYPVGYQTAYAKGFYGTRGTIDGTADGSNASITTANYRYTTANTSSTNVAIYKAAYDATFSSAKGSSDAIKDVQNSNPRKASAPTGVDQNAYMNAYNNSYSSELAKLPFQVIYASYGRHDIKDTTTRKNVTSIVQGKITNNKLQFTANSYNTLFSPSTNQQPGTLFVVYKLGNYMHASLTKDNVDTIIPYTLQKIDPADTGFKIALTWYGNLAASMPVAIKIIQNKSDTLTTDGIVNVKNLCTPLISNNQITFTGSSGEKNNLFGDPTASVVKSFLAIMFQDNILFFQILGENEAGIISIANATPSSDDYIQGKSAGSSRGTSDGTAGIASRNDPSVTGHPDYNAWNAATDKNAFKTSYSSAYGAAYTPAYNTYTSTQQGKTAGSSRGTSDGSAGTASRNDPSVTGHPDYNTWNSATDKNAFKSSYSTNYDAAYTSATNGKIAASSRGSSDGAAGTASRNDPSITDHPDYNAFNTATNRNAFGSAYSKNYDTAYASATNGKTAASSRGSSDGSAGTASRNDPSIIDHPDYNAWNASTDKNAFKSSYSTNYDAAYTSAFNTYTSSNNGKTTGSSRGTSDGSAGTASRNDPSITGHPDYNAFNTATDKAAYKTAYSSNYDSAYTPAFNTYASNTSSQQGKSAGSSRGASDGAAGIASRNDPSVSGHPDNAAYNAATDKTAYKTAYSSNYDSTYTPAFNTYTSSNNGKAAGSSRGASDGAAGTASRNDPSITNHPDYNAWNAATDKNAFKSSYSTNYDAAYTPAYASSQQGKADALAFKPAASTDANYMSGYTANYSADKASAAGTSSGNTQGLHDAGTPLTQPKTTAPAGTTTDYSTAYMTAYNTAFFPERGKIDGRNNASTDPRTTKQTIAPFNTTDANKIAYITAYDTEYYKTSGTIDGQKDIAQNNPAKTSSGIAGISADHEKIYIDAYNIAYAAAPEDTKNGIAQGLADGTRDGNDQKIVTPRTDAPAEYNGAPTTDAFKVAYLNNYPKTFYPTRGTVDGIIDGAKLLASPIYKFEVTDYKTKYDAVFTDTKNGTQLGQTNGAQAAQTNTYDTMPPTLFNNITTNETFKSAYAKAYINAFYTTYGTLDAQKDAQAGIAAKTTIPAQFANSTDDQKKTYMDAYTAAYGQGNQTIQQATALGTTRGTEDATNNAPLNSTPTQDQGSLFNTAYANAYTKAFYQTRGTSDGQADGSMLKEVSYKYDVTQPQIAEYKAYYDAAHGPAQDQALVNAEQAGTNDAQEDIANNLPQRTEPKIPGTSLYNQTYLNAYTIKYEELVTERLIMQALQNAGTQTGTNDAAANKEQNPVPSAEVADAYHQNENYKNIFDTAYNTAYQAEKKRQQDVAAAAAATTQEQKDAGTKAGTEAGINAAKDAAGSATPPQLTDKTTDYIGAFNTAYTTAYQTEKKRLQDAASIAAVSTQEQTVALQKIIADANTVLLNIAQNITTANKTASNALTLARDAADKGSTQAQNVLGAITTVLSLINDMSTQYEAAQNKIASATTTLQADNALKEIIALSSAANAVSVKATSVKAQADTLATTPAPAQVPTSVPTPVLTPTEPATTPVQIPAPETPVQPAKLTKRQLQEQGTTDGTADGQALLPKNYKINPGKFPAYKKAYDAAYQAAKVRQKGKPQAKKQPKSQKQQATKAAAKALRQYYQQ